MLISYGYSLATPFSGYNLLFSFVTILTFTYMSDVVSYHDVEEL